MLTRMETDEFDRFYEILKESFPTDEYRSYRKQKKLLENRYYRIFKDNDKKGEIRGVIATFEFPDFSFVEHLAVQKAYRNQGIGEKLLQNFCKYTNRSVVLEVELPNSELNKRRIAFYRRCGFSFHNYDYVQPSIDSGRNPIPLALMTYPQEDKVEAELDFYKTSLYREVYGLKQ